MAEQASNMRDLREILDHIIFEIKASKEHKTADWFEEELESSGYFILPCIPTDEMIKPFFAILENSDKTDEDFRDLYGQMAVWFRASATRERLNKGSIDD